MVGEPGPDSPSDLNCKMLAVLAVLGLDIIAKAHQELTVCQDLPILPRASCGGFCYSYPRFTEGKGNYPTPYSKEEVERRFKPGPFSAS